MTGHLNTPLSIQVSRASAMGDALERLAPKLPDRACILRTHLDRGEIEVQLLRRSIRDTDTLAESLGIEPGSRRSYPGGRQVTHTWRGSWDGFFLVLSVVIWDSATAGARS